MSDRTTTDPTTVDAHPPEDLLVDLALGDLDDLQRNASTAHLARCEACRSEYSAIADTLEHLLPAAPWVAPPPGFSRSVIEAMGLAGAAGADDRPTDGAEVLQLQRRQRPAARALLVGLAAALALLLGVSGAVLLAMSHSARQELTAAGPAIVTSSGERVGQVSDAWYDGQPVLIVRVDAAPAGQRYRCTLVLADGTRQPAGEWTMPASGSATWVIDRPAGELVGMELLTATGRTWATADLSAPPT